MDIYKKQIGGNHYTVLPIQPWEIIEKNQLDFFAGNCLKYLLRHQTKWPNNPAKQREDLLKARQYLDFMIGRIDDQN